MASVVLLSTTVAGYGSIPFFVFSTTHHHPALAPDIVIGNPIPPPVVPVVPVVPQESFSKVTTTPTRHKLSHTPIPTSTSTTHTKRIKVRAK